LLGSPLFASFAFDLYRRLSESGIVNLRADHLFASEVDEDIAAFIHWNFKPAVIFGDCYVATFPSACVTVCLFMM
jgi:hypothetical protein